MDRESKCLVWGSLKVNKIIDLNLWLWKVNGFFMCTGEEVHRGISHNASLWAAGHNFHQIIVVNTNMTNETCACVYI